MNICRLKRFSSDEKGTTLVEVVIVILISSIAISGLAITYVDSIRMMNSETDKMVMYTEAEAAFNVLSEAVTYADFVTTRTSLNRPSDYLLVRGLDSDGSGYAERNFYYNSVDKSFRWNDLSGDRGRFNLMLIPLFDYTEGPQDDPYISVEELTFTAIDEHDPSSPTTDGYAIIRVDMKLRSPRGDSLMVSRAVAKFNQKQ
jgi:Flp pilus assembly pilin Flp